MPSNFAEKCPAFLRWETLLAQRQGLRQGRRTRFCKPALEIFEGPNVAAGVPREEILRNYAALTDPDIDAALGYAAELTREGTVDLPLEIKA